METELFPSHEVFGGDALAHGTLTQILRTQALSAPLTVTWEITNRCNLRCAHCLSNSGPDASTQGELNLAEAQDVVEQLAAQGVFQIHFGGGEPFLYAGFMELLRSAQRNGFCCLCISTNGSALTPGRIRELEALGGIYLQLSLDGVEAASCDAVRGRGAYQAALRALERLRGSTIVRTVNFVYCRHNAHELQAMYALAQRYGATLRVTRLKPSGRGLRAYAALRPTQAQLATLHSWLQAHADVLHGDTFFHLNPLGSKALSGMPFCGAARMTALITPQGDVYPCAFTQTPRFRAGNLRKHSFRTIWNESAVFNDLFRRSPQGDCTRCGAFSSCGGGCPAVKDALHGRLDIPDPDCVLEMAVEQAQSGARAPDEGADPPRRLESAAASRFASAE